jgi:leader peptidase (prepilin peptidase)/N-methyltransferase
MFNLDEAIADWRRQMLAAGINTPVPMDELESHLRDDVEQQTKLGLGAQKAFESAVQRIGRAGALKREFTKVGEPWRVFQRKSLWLFIGVAFLSCWLQFRASPSLALTYCILLAGLIVAAFIDFKHFNIPDEITLGGIFTGFLCSLLLPSLHGQKLVIPGLLQSLLGIGAGAGLAYFVLRVGKLAFGRQRLALLGETKIIFTETALLLPDKEIAYQELFSRKTDAITLRARTVEFEGRSYRDVRISLTPADLQIGGDTFASEDVSRLEATTEEILLPREAMGLGDVKFMAAIGAFLGWQAVVFSLIASSLFGSLVGVGLIAVRRQKWSAQLPYGPYLALAATIWIFAGRNILGAWFPG